MVYDSIANALIPNVASNAKDFGKKKRVNRTAKLKQSKLDVRREQWLSQVKNRGVGVKEETKVSGGVKRADAEAHAVNERELSMVKLEVSVGKEGQEGHRAWRPDDASRPQSLPNLLKQNSFPMQSGSHHGLIFAPSSCPICCEDLDMTDSSFLPCPCGYRLCLFCHKKILEDNGRCPGCRKQYEQTDNKTATFKLTRCYSVNPRR
ncbi:putative transcription factor C2H2 family [Helianthus annuus]|nr:putative transcription factor C2H2 family [Helianthus annuus]